MEQKHFVLVHGACHGAWIWYKLKPMLESAGHRDTAMDLAGSGMDMKPIEQVCSADEYSEPLLKIMESIPPVEKVILVGEHMGGIIAAIAMDNYSKKIAVAVFANAFLPDTTHKPSYVFDKYMEVSQNDWEDCKFSSFIGANNETISSLKLGPQFLLSKAYQQCPVEDYQLATMLTRPGTFFQEVLANCKKFTNEGYGSVTRVSIIGREDKIVTEEFQQWEIENIGVEKVYKMEGGDHMLMFSKPKELLKCLIEIAAAYA